MSESPKSSGSDGDAGAHETRAAAEGSRRRSGEGPAAESSNDEGTREVSTTEEQGSTAVREPGTTGQGPRAAEAASENTQAAESTAQAAENTAQEPERPARAPEGGEPATTARSAAKAMPKSLTFHLTRTSLLAVAVVAVCASPIAWAQPFPYLLPTYLIPAALAYAVLWPRTIATADGIRTRLLAGETSFGWEELASVRLNERRWVRAVLGSDDEGRGREVRLSAVRVRDLSHLALMSGGRLPDPKEQRERPAEAAAAADGEQAPEAADAESAGSESASPEPAGSEPGNSESRPESALQPPESAEHTGKSAAERPDATTGQQESSATAGESTPDENSPDQRRG